MEEGPLPLKTLAMNRPSAGVSAMPKPKKSTIWMISIVFMAPFLERRQNMKFSIDRLVNAGAIHIKNILMTGRKR